MKRRILTLALTALLLSGLPLLSSCKPKTDPVAEQYANLHSQESIIYWVLNDSDARLIEMVNLGVIRDDAGNLLYTGELKSSAAPFLKDLVDSYNADPSTTIPITQDEVETALTADIVKSTENVIDNKDDSFVAFVLWCQDDADLVYKGDVPNVDGSVSKGGDTGCPNFEFSWEYDAQ